MTVSKKAALTVVGALLVAGIGSGQVKELIKVIGVGAVVQRFGPDMNKAINKLAKHTDTSSSYTKVVPIITLGSRNAIGGAQVMGVKWRVDKVKAVAQLDQTLFGSDVKVRAMIPVESNNLSNIKKVEGVGISGIVDLKL